MTAGNAGITWPHLRRIELDISGLKNTNDRKLVSDGTPNNLKITAHVVKQLGIADPAQIMVWNLSNDTKAGLQRQKTKIRIRAGWDFGPRAGLQDYFVGDLLNSNSFRAGSAIITNIYAMSALDAMATATVHETFSAMPVADVVEKLARKLQEHDSEISVDRKRIKDIEGKTPEKGWPWSGSVREGLNALARTYGFTWGVVDRNFYAVGDTKNVGGQSRVESPYLIDVNPVFAAPQQVALGVCFRCVADPTLLPCHQVSVKSSLSDMAAKYNGEYTIRQVVHDLDCYKKMAFVTTGTAFAFGKGENNG